MIYKIMYNINYSDVLICKLTNSSTKSNKIVNKKSNLLTLNYLYINKVNKVNKKITTFRGNKKQVEKTQLIYYAGIYRKLC